MNEKMNKVSNRNVSIYLAGNVHPDCNEKLRKYVFEDRKFVVS